MYCHVTTSNRFAEPLAIQQLHLGSPMTGFFEHIALTMRARQRRDASCRRWLVDVAIHPGRVALVAYHEYVAAIATRSQPERSGPALAAEADVEGGGKRIVRMAGHNTLGGSVEQWSGEKVLRTNRKRRDESVALNDEPHVRRAGPTATIAGLATYKPYPAA